MKTIEFRVAFYTVLDKSLICPDNSTQAGDIVIGLYPLKIIDPMKKYAIVVTPCGSETVSRRFIQKRNAFTLSLAAVPRETSNAFKRRQHEAMYAALRDEIEGEPEKNCDWLNDH